MMRTCDVSAPSLEPSGRAYIPVATDMRAAGFARFAAQIASLTGRPATFALAAATILAWAVSGPMFHWSDTWQLVINTGTTIVTFLVVFLIQNTQNRDTEVINLKLDELLRAVEGARTSFVGLNEVSDEELADLHAQFSRMVERYGGLIGDDLDLVQREIAERQRSS